MIARYLQTLDGPPITHVLKKSLNLLTHGRMTFFLKVVKEVGQGKNLEKKF
jgi:hypothetical protein